MTPEAWLGVALADLDALLEDHAHCEKKAAAQALALVAAYPACERLVRRLTGLAIEELRHFREVYARLRARGRTLGRDPGDPYARALRGLLRAAGSERAVDRLLVAGLIEARSHERLALLARGISDPELAGFYAGLAQAEAGHATLFVDLAGEFAATAEVRVRLEELATRESEIVAGLPLQPRIH